MKIKNILNLVKKIILGIIFSPIIIVLIIVLLAKGMFRDEHWKERQDWINQAD